MSMRVPPLAALLTPALALMLAACQETAPPPPPVAAPAVAAPAPTARAAKGPAETACVAAVAKQTKASGVQVISSEASQAGTSVELAVPGAERPWACVWQRGKVVKVEYTGEG